jgi:hypothetical protein
MPPNKRAVNHSMTLDEFFSGFQNSRPIFDTLRTAIDDLGPTEMRVSKSQISFWRRTAVARVWIPARYLHGYQAPLVITLGFFSRDPSPRWKVIVEPTTGRFTHHLELFSASDVDEQVLSWLRRAWAIAA